MMDEQFEKDTVQNDERNAEVVDEEPVNVDDIQPEVTDEEQSPAKEAAFSLGKEIFEWVYTIAIALVIAFLIKTFLFDVVKVEGLSMDPTLQHNDRLIISKLAYKPEQGDIVILDATYKDREAYYDYLEDTTGEKISGFQKWLSYSKLPDALKKKFYVKRIIALPGQTVDIQNGYVLVDGEVLDEPYLVEQTKKTDPTVSYPITVAEDCVFVMGDNRDGSTDSRSSLLGQVPIDALLGKSQIRIFPFNNIGITR